MSILPEEVVVNLNDSDFREFEKNYNNGFYTNKLKFEYESLGGDVSGNARLHQAYAAHLFLKSITQKVASDTGLYKQMFLRISIKYTIHLQDGLREFTLQLRSLDKLQTKFLFTREDDTQAIIIVKNLGADSGASKSSDYPTFASYMHQPKEIELKDLLKGFHDFEQHYDNDTGVWEEWKFTYQELVDVKFVMKLSKPVAARNYQAYAANKIIKYIVASGKDYTAFLKVTFKCVFNSNLKFSLKLRKGGMVGPNWVYEFDLIRDGSDNPLSNATIKAILLKPKPALSGGESKSSLLKF